jgi:hypothetical protein
MPPPKRGGGGGLVIGLIGGGLVLLIIIAVAVYASTGSADKTPAEKLTAAIANMDTARVVTLKGTFGGAFSARGELNVTKGGRLMGPITLYEDDKKGDSFTILAADGKLFLKADKSYWDKKSTITTPYDLESGAAWGRLHHNYSIPIEDKKPLTPSVLAGELRSAETLRVVTLKTTWHGKKALKFSTSSSTLYITDDDDAELLHYKTSSPPFYDVDVSPKHAGDAAALISDMRESMGELKDSFDGTDQPHVAEWKKAACNQDSGCTVQARILPPLTVQTPVTIDVRFSITAGTSTGKNLGNCTARITITADSQWASCQIFSSAWKSWAATADADSHFYDHAQYKVMGATSAEVQALQKGLDSE